MNLVDLFTRYHFRMDDIFRDLFYLHRVGKYRSKDTYHVLIDMADLGNIDNVIKFRKLAEEHRIYVEEKTIYGCLKRAFFTICVEPKSGGSMYLSVSGKYIDKYSLPTLDFYDYNYDLYKGKMRILRNIYLINEENNICINIQNIIVYSFFIDMVGKYFELIGSFVNYKKLPMKLARGRYRIKLYSSIGNYCCTTGTEDCKIYIHYDTRLVPQANIHKTYDCNGTTLKVEQISINYKPKTVTHLL